MNIGIIILAAGSSKRMGKSKQLLRIGNEMLIQRSVRIALSTSMKPVVIVLGSGEDEHRKALDGSAVEAVVNTKWQSGMGSSLKVGLSAIKKNRQIDAVIVMVCDQPLLSTNHLITLGEQYIATRKPIVASYYAGTTGVPALFDKTLFDEIETLSDKEGAKKLIVRHPNETIGIAFPEGSIDLDTPEDFKNFTDKL